MKILMVNTLYAPYRVGGAEYSVQLRSQSLARAGHHLVVVTLDPVNGPDRRVDQHGITVRRISLRNLYWPYEANPSLRNVASLATAKKALWHAIDSFNPAMAHHLDRILAEEQPDVVHTQNLFGFSVSTWQAAKRRGVPIVHTLRDYYLLCPNHAMFKPWAVENCATQCTSCHVLSIPRKRASGAVDAVTGITRFVLDVHLDAGYFPNACEKVVIQPPSTGAPVVADAPRPAPRGRPLRFAFLGTVEPRKGVSWLLEAWSGLPHGVAELTIAGSGNGAYVRSMREAFPRADVSFVGFQASDDVYAASDVVVVPSLWREPMGRVPLEAAAHALPAIVSRTGGLQEVVDDGVTGLHVPTADVEALGRTLLRCIEDRELVARLGAAALERARERIADDGTAAFEAVYERVMGLRLPRRHLRVAQPPTERKTSSTRATAASHE